MSKFRMSRFQSQGWGAVLSVAMVFAAMPSTAQEKVEWPATTPAKVFQEWLGFCAAPNAEAWTKWNATHYDEKFLGRHNAQEITEHDTSECNQQGGYRAVRVVDSKPEEITVAVEGIKTGVLVQVFMAVNKESKIAGVGMMPAEIPESSLPKDLSDAEVKKVAQESVDRLAKLDMFSGIVYVARGSEPIAVVTGGYADRAKKTAITPQTQFTLGSMGKMFTAAGIGQMVDQGKISYEDPVGKFFPDYPNKTVREKVTVGMLLSHTSGMGDFLGKRTPEMMKKGVKRAAEFMPLYDNDEPKFAPGTSWSYSNAGLALVGAILEKVSGEDYPDYIRKHIFAPAGMKNSDPNNIPHTDPRMVTPYTHQTEKGPTTEWQEAEHDIGSPAGGAISTAEDLAHFADALRSGKLVSKATFSKMTESHGKTPWGGNYGYAMEIENVYGRTVVGHGGGFPGVNTDLAIVLDSPYTVITLANMDPPAANFAEQRVKALVVEKAKQGK